MRAPLLQGMWRRRHAAVNIQQGIDGLHTCPHGILGSENSISGCFGKLTDESEVHSAIGHYFRTIGFFSRLEKGVDIRHKTSGGIAGILGKSVNFFGRNTNMVQPFTANLFAAACASFDFYPNFEVRGRHYKELVNAL